MLGTAWGIEMVPALVVAVKLKAVSALPDNMSIWGWWEVERSVHT
jgi:hypothetical protein